MTDIPLRDQIARISRWPWAEGLAPGVPSQKDFDIADALLEKFEIYPRPGKEPEA